MAGLGRRSHYRKHLTDAVINDLPEPNFDKGERIAKVLGSRGGNLLEVDVAQWPPSDEADESENASVDLALLPTKFRKLVWVKRGDYLIVVGDDTADASKDDKNTNTPVTATGESIKVRYMVQHILYVDQVKHLKSIKNGEVWPSRFTDSAEGKSSQPNVSNSSNENNHIASPCKTDAGDMTFETAADSFVNTNRVASMMLDSDEEEDSDSE